MTEATADELAKTLSEGKGYKATAVGNMVLVEATPTTALQLSQLTQAAVARDKAKAAGDPAKADELKRRQTDLMKTMPLKRDLAKPRAR